MRKELKELKETETEGKWYKIKNGKIVPKRKNRKREGTRGERGRLQKNKKAFGVGDGMRCTV